MADDRSNPRNWLGPYADADTGWLALRAAERPAYLASALAEYLDVRAWTPDQLAQYLRCAPQQLAKLGLCLRPDRNSVEFHQQVSQIVSHFQLDYWGLRRLLEELALDDQQRKQVWLMADFGMTRSGEPHPRSAAKQMRASSPAPRSDEAVQRERARSSEGFMGDGVPSFGEQVHVARTAEMSSHSVSAHRPSWFGRLLSRVRKFFSKK